MSSSHQGPLPSKNTKSETLSEELATYHSIFRDYINSDSSKRQQRSIREVEPATLLALELYIYLITYTPMTHEDVCVIMFQIMQPIDWEMLAMLDEARDLRVPNIYDAEDNIEEEDLWSRIRGLPEDHITSCFDHLMHRLDALGFSVTGVLRKQMGRRTWMVVFEGYCIPVGKQPALVHSRFDIDPSAIIDDSQPHPYRSIWVPRGHRFIDFAHENAENTPPNVGSGDYVEVYDLTREDDHGGFYDGRDDIDDELARVLALSRKEF